MPVHHPRGLKLTPPFPANQPPSPPHVGAGGGVGGEGDEEECSQLIGKRGRTDGNGRRVMMGGAGRGLTIFAAVDPRALVLPDDEGWRRADHVADDDGVVALVELLRTGGVLEGDLLCGGGGNNKNNNNNNLTSHTRNCETLKHQQLECFCPFPPFQSTRINRRRPDVYLTRLL